MRTFTNDYQAVTNIQAKPMRLSVLLVVVARCSMIGVRMFDNINSISFDKFFSLSQNETPEHANYTTGQY